MELFENISSLSEPPIQPNGLIQSKSQLDYPRIFTFDFLFFRPTEKIKIDQNYMY